MKYEKIELEQIHRTFSDINSYVKNRTGAVNISKTMKKHGFSPTNSTVVGILRDAVIQNGLKLHASNAKIHGMPYIGGTFDDLCRPAVYAIACTKTDRKYIGSSVRPDLRRATHLYWLKNIDEPGTSNIFINCKQLKKDVQKYGVDSFYIELLEVLPVTTTNDELREIEDRYLSNTPSDKLYNFTHSVKGGAGNYISASKPKEVQMYKKLKEERLALQQELRRIRKNYTAWRLLNRHKPGFLKIRAEHYALVQKLKDKITNNKSQIDELIKKVRSKA